MLGLGTVAVNELYAALDWLSAQQPQIEAKLARCHLGEGALVLYDVTSSYLEGRCCPLARFGYSRDGKSHKLQIVFGVLCSRDGCPIAVEVFAGNTADPSTLKTQIDKLRQRFGLRRVVLVGDRGMITQARISQELQPLGLDWITALRAPEINSPRLRARSAANAGLRQTARRHRTSLAKDPGAGTPPTPAAARRRGHR